MIGGGEAFEYKTPFKGPHEIFQMWKNGTVTLQTGAVTTRVIIRRIEHYKNNTEEVNASTCRKRKAHIYIQHIYM